VRARLALCTALAGILLASCSSGDRDEPLADSRSYTGSYTGSYTERPPQPVEPLGPALVRWRIGSVDSRFELTEAQVREAVERAEALWENAAGMDLFQYDEVNGMPISLVFDHRQQRRVEQRSARKQLDQMRVQMESLQREFKSAADALKAKYAEYESALRAYNEQVREHNRSVASWNRAGGAPQDVARQLREESSRLRSLRTALEMERNGLIREENAVELKRRRYNALVDQYNKRVEQYNQRFGKNWEEEAGRYEAVVGPKRSNERITIYVVEDLDYLTLIVAHELGHALGIEHVEDERAIMYAYTQQRQKDGSYAIRITEADLAALRDAIAKR